jgi:colanic acid biosynthesis glycosyl transferase WcaI
MRILYLSQYFPPEMGAPAARVYELSREWAALGHDVTVLTGFPNHPTGVVPPAYRGEAFRRERVDGIEVVRTPIYAAPNAGILRRAANYGSYALSASTVGAFLARRRPDVLIATSPQLLTAVAGLWVSTLERVPFVFEVRDIWPRSIVEVGALPAGHPAIWALERLELFLYRRADRVVVVTDSFVDELAARGVPREKLRVVKNGVDLELFKPMPRDNEIRRELGLEPGHFMSLYVGTHGMAHGLETILAAADRLKDRPEFRFVLVGEGADKAALKTRAAELRLQNVTFVDKQARERIPLYLAASDLSLVLLREKPLFKTVLPSKIFEILGAGRPLVLGVDGEARRLVEAASAGVYVRPEDAAGLADALMNLRGRPGDCEQMGRKGRAFVEAHYGRRALAEKYLGVLRELSEAQ